MSPKKSDFVAPFLDKIELKESSTKVLPPQKVESTESTTIEKKDTISVIKPPPLNPPLPPVNKEALPPLPNKYGGPSISKDELYY